LAWKVSSFHYTLTVSYEPATILTEERVRIECVMPDQHWFSIGFGNSMHNTDMIAWTTQGSSSYVTDYWSIARKEPEVDEV